MKKTTLLFLLLPVLAGAQSKATDPISVQNFNAGLLLNRTTETVTLTMIGPSDRWLAVQYGQFSGGMEAGSDVVYFDGNTLVDATHNGIGSAPSPDTENNWSVIENTVSSGLRTIRATRPFDSPDTGDYDFNYDDSTIGMALARGNFGGTFALSYHGSSNRIVDTAVTFTSLGNTEFELEAVKLFPNPAHGEFSVTSIDALEEIVVYSMSGSLVKKIVPQQAVKTMKVADLSTGSYLVEIKSTKGSSWKKLLVE